MARLAGLYASTGGGASRSRIAFWIRPFVVDLGCCGMSALQLASPAYGLPAYDGRWYDLAPYQANVLIVAGRVTSSCSVLIEAVHAQMKAPRWVIACGDCAASGTLFGTIPVSDLLPVDLEIRGCPPRTEDLYGVLARLLARRRR